MFYLRSISPFYQKDLSFEKTHLCFCEMWIWGKILHSKCKDPPSKVEKVLEGGEEGLSGDRD